MRLLAIAAVAFACNQEPSQPSMTGEWGGTVHRRTDCTDGTSADVDRELSLVALAMDGGVAVRLDGTCDPLFAVTSERVADLAARKACPSTEPGAIPYVNGMHLQFNETTVDLTLNTETTFADNGSCYSMTTGALSRVR